MSVTPIANILSELLPSTSEVPLFDPNEGFVDFGKDKVVASKSKVDRELEESYEKGFADGISKAKEEMDEAFGARQIESERQEAEARLKLVQESVDGLVREISEQQKEKTLAVQFMVSEVLKALIEKGALSAAVKKIEGMVERELDGKTSARIQLSGPEPIVSELAERLTMHHLDVDVRHTDIDPESRLDVQVQIDSTVIRSRLSEWKQTVEALLA